LVTHSFKRKKIKKKRGKKKEEKGEKKRTRDLILDKACSLYEVLYRSSQDITSY